MANYLDNLSLGKLFIAHLLNLLVLRDKKNYFPKRIDKFEFKKIITNKMRRTTLAIYQDQNQKVIVKTYQGNFKIMDYYILKNEIAVSELLRNILKRLQKRIPSDLKNIKIPETLFIKESASQLFVVSEFIESVSLKSKSTSKQVEIYLKVIRLLKFLGDNMTEREKNKFSKRNGATLVKLYPLLLFKSVLTHPSLFFKLLKSIPIFIKLRKVIYKLKIVLSHRDLHLDNILVSGKNIYLIDLEFTLFGPEIFDEIMTLRYEWNNNVIKKQLIAEIKKKYSFYNNLDDILRILALSVATHSLTANNFPKSLKNNYFNLLEYSLNSKAFKN